MTARLNVPCAECGTTELPLHTNHRCPNCYEPVPRCGYCCDSTGSEVCGREADSWVIGWDSNVTTSRWFLIREDGTELSVHETHNDALRHAMSVDSSVEYYHEADGGGCLGPFDPHDSPYNDEDESP